MAVRIPLVDILGKRGIWLLEFEVGGRPFRFAEERVTVTTEAGVEIRYSEGLAPLALPVVTGARPSIPVSISSDVDWALLVAEGSPLDLGAATLRRFFQGQTLERARVHVRGQVESPSYDKKGSDLTFTVSERPGRLADRIVRPGARVDSNTWPISSPGFSIDKKSGKGRAYPWFFGVPGQLPDGSIVAAVPVPTVEFKANDPGTRVGLCRDAIEATSVTIFDATDTPITSSVRSVVMSQDLLNLPISTATIGPPPLQTAEGGRHFYAGYGLSTGGGLLRRDRSGALRGAGEITRYLMERFIRRVDLDPRFDAAEDFLNNWKIDTYLDGEDLSWWDFLTKELWPLLPAVVVRGPAGIYLEVIDFAATSSDVIYELNADRRGVVRAPGVETVNGATIANQITLKYCPKRDSGVFHEELTVSGEAGYLRDRAFAEPRDRRVLANVFCRRSQSLYGRRSVVRTTHMIWDRSTAGLTLGWWAARDSIPRRRLTYTGSHGLESVPPWKPVLIRDSELHYDGVIGWLEPVIAGAAEDTATVIVQDHPHIGRRPTV